MASLVYLKGNNKETQTQERENSSYNSIIILIALIACEEYVNNPLTFNLLDWNRCFIET